MQGDVIVQRRTEIPVITTTTTGPTPESAIVRRAPVSRYRPTSSPTTASPHQPCRSSVPNNSPSRSPSWNQRPETPQLEGGSSGVHRHAYPPNGRQRIARHCQSLVTGRLDDEIGWWLGGASGDGAASARRTRKTRSPSAIFPEAFSSCSGGRYLPEAAASRSWLRTCSRFIRAQS